MKLYSKKLFLCIGLILVLFIPVKELRASAACEGFFSSIESQELNPEVFYKNFLKLSKKITKYSKKDFQLKKMRSLVEDLVDLNVSATQAHNLKAKFGDFMITLRSKYLYRYNVRGQDDGLKYDYDKVMKFEVEIIDGLIFDKKGNLVDTHGEKWIFTRTSLGLFMTKESSKEGRFMKHTTLSLGLPIMAAGEIIINKGKITLVNNRSGRYRPSPFMLEQFIVFLDNKNVDTKGIQVRLDHHRKENYMTPAEVRYLKDLNIPIDPIWAASTQKALELMDIFLIKLDKGPKDKEELYDTLDFLTGFGQFAVKGEGVIKSVISFLSSENNSSYLKRKFISDDAFKGIYRNLSAEQRIQYEKALIELTQGPLKDNENLSKKILRFIDRMNKRVYI